MLEEILFHLEEKIKNSIEMSDLETLFKNLREIKNPTILCGVGGSHVVSIFLEKILIEKNNIIARNMDVEEYLLCNTNSFDNLILVSHSGKNHGIKSLMNIPKNKFLLTTRKSKINNETLLRYSIKDRIKSFISLEDTFIPLSICLCYYLNTYKLPFSINFGTENFNIKKFENINIIYDYNSKTCASFLETTFVEAGVAPVTMHTKYSLCHGRSNLISNHESLDIYLVTKNTELDKMLKEQLPKISNNFLILEEKNLDPIIADFNLTIKALSFLNYLNKKFNIEFVNVHYNKIVPTIYHFKGELA